MRIAVIGDFHGSHKRPAFELFLAEVRPDVVLCVGDLQDYRGFSVPFHFIRGNHECWAVLDELRAGSLHAPNLSYLPDGVRITLGTFAVAGVGGNWSPTETKAHPRFIRHRYLEDMRRTHADIVLSHETPIRFSDGKHDELTLPALRELCVRMAPRFWFSGHHHHFDIEQLGRTTIVSLGKWPRTWGWLDTDERGGPSFHRFEPADRAGYDALMYGWLAAEKHQKDILYPADKRGIRYGV
jgi:predicted phosphodiesterase